jgi:hypothetical protein
MFAPLNYFMLKKVTYKEIFLSLSFFILSFTVIAQNTQYTPDKSQYTLFKPTPVNSLRDMETDRPDVTESPYTVDAGHFQYEGDLSRLTITEDAGLKNSNVGFNNGTYKIGITNTIDFHIAFESYVLNYQKSNKSNNSIITGGFGDVVLRVKKNLIGDDSGEFALAILPFIKVPTMSFYKNNNFEGGVIFPYTLNLNHEWSIGGEVELQLLKQAGAHIYKPFYLQSFVAEHELTKKLGFFLETHYTYSDDLGRFENYVNGGLIFLVKTNLHFDCGLNYGVQSYAYKSYFAGLSFRI